MRVEHNKTRNLQEYKKYIEEASSKGADFLAFPETSLQGYTWAFNPGTYSFFEEQAQRRYFEAESEPVPGPSTRVVQEHCKKHSMIVQMGMAEKVSDGGRTRIFNSAVLLDGSGVLGLHRKVYMAPNAIFSLGDGFSVFRTRVGTIGPLICGDLVPWESTRDLALQGAEIAALSTAWGMKGDNPRTDYNGYQYDLLTRTNAMANQVWLVASDQVGQPMRIAGGAPKGGASDTVESFHRLERS